MLRLLIGLPVAAAITAGLFYLMGGLIAPGEFEPDEKKPVPTLPTMRPDTKTVREPQPEARPEIVPPAPIRPVRSGPDAPGGIDVPPPPNPMDGSNAPIVLGPSGPVPIATVPPSYPPSCQSRATEGYAVVRFDVTLQGQVVNARVTDSSHRCFERAALSAIRSWRYQPAATKETGYIARGVTRRFTFNLN